MVEYTTGVEAEPDTDPATLSEHSEAKGAGRQWLKIASILLTIAIIIYGYLIIKKI